MNACRPGLLILLLIISVLTVVSSNATNFFDRHGNNFIYLDSNGTESYDTLTYAPVIWDLRSASIDLHDYYVTYGWETDSTFDSTYNAIDLLMDEAHDHGINFANTRGEIMRMDGTDFAGGPDSTDFFVNMAKYVRLNSLNLIAGGFRTDTSSYNEAHNDSVVSYLDQYLDYSYSWPESAGDFLGIFGFDEPDARYEGPSWYHSNEDSVWYDLVIHYATECRDSISDDVIPFGTFLDRWKTEDDTLSIKYYQETIPLFCGALDYPVFDRYPCQFRDPVNDTFPDQIEFDEIIGSTDLLPSDSVDYYAYATQDEIFAVDDSGWVRIYEFENVTSWSDTIEISKADSVRLPDSLRSDPIWAASDFRAADVGDRDSGTNRLNGAVLFFDDDDPDENMVIFHDGSDLEFLEDSIQLPRYATGITAVGVGEYNFPVHFQSAASRRGNVISRGELRILVCYQASDQQVTVDSVRVFAWDYSNGGFDDVTDDSGLGLELDFTPTGVVWGVFWPTHYYKKWDPPTSDDESGFIVYDENGNYHAIYESRSLLNPVWNISREYTNLVDMDETSFIARQTHLFPCYVAGMDYICHLREADEDSTQAVLEFMSDPADTVGSSLTEYESDEIELPGSYDFDDVINAASCRPYRFYDDALLVSIASGASESEVYRSSGMINLQGGNGISISLDTDEDLVDTVTSVTTPILTSPRICVVRQTYRTPVLDHTTTLFPDRVLLPYCDIQADNIWEIMFGEQHESLDTMFVYGIDSTSSANCLMHNLRFEGRRQDGQLTFYPSADTLLYLMTTSLVHGCRGVHLRALDLTMRCGNGGGASQVGTYRCPDLMLNWGPSVESTNPDMISKMLDVVQDVTGEGSSNPDFMDALIDEDYAAMDTTDAQNAIRTPSGWQYADWNTDNNFIALFNTSSEDILLYAVNDSDSLLAEDDNYIYFPDKYFTDYSVEYIAGFECDTTTSKSYPELNLDFSDMPAYSASLYLIEYNGN